MTDKALAGLSRMAKAVMAFKPPAGGLKPPPVPSPSDLRRRFRAAGRARAGKPS